MRQIATIALLFGVPLLLGACASGTPAVDRGEPLSYDGLTPVTGTLMTRVWIREGFSLEGYHKVILESAGIQFRPVTRPAANGKRTAATEFPLSAGQKAELQRLIREEFEKALERLTLDVVTEPGPDVLRVRGMILDVVSRVPPEGTEAARYFLDSVGQATFVVELIDSQTSTVLVRALDTRAARVPGAGQRSTAAGNRARVRALIARWANLLVDALNDLTAIDELQGT